MTFSIEAQDGAWGVMRQGKPVLTPKKRPLAAPSRALAEAVAHEWEAGGGKGVSALAATAIDLIADEREGVERALIAYAETDLLCYRSETPELRALQASRWDPLLAWARTRYDCAMQVTEGLMPVEQSAVSLARFAQVLSALTPMELAAVSSLTQSLGSLLLALAVVEAHLSAKEAFVLSRVDEDYQAVRWGADERAAQRADSLREDCECAERFLMLLRHK